MKIALLNDTHFGARNDSPAFLEYFMRFYNEIFFPYLKENNIKTLVHLGDVVDRRKFINFKTAHTFRQDFMHRLYKEGIDTHIILGNHDTYYKNTNEVNAINELCTTYDGIKEPWIYDKAVTKNFGGTDICLIPWICDDNYEDSEGIRIKRPLKGNYHLKGRDGKLSKTINRSDLREKILKNSPKENKDFFVVPKVVE